MECIYVILRNTQVANGITRVMQRNIGATTEMTYVILRNSYIDTNDTKLILIITEVATKNT